MKHFILITFLLLCNSAFAQKEEEKEMYEDMVKDVDYTWIYQTKQAFKMPEDLKGFANDLNNAAITGKIFVEDFNQNKLNENELRELLSSIDTILMLHPLTLKETQRYEEKRNVKSELLWLNEVWYFDSKDFKLKSRINYINPFFEIYDLDEKYLGVKTYFSRINESVNAENAEEYIITRSIKFDSTGYNQFPIKMLFGEAINDIIIQHIDEFNIVDEDGNTIGDNQEVIGSIEMEKPYYGNFIHFLDPKGIINIEVEEIWLVDFENFSIEKRITKLTPVTRYFPDLEGAEQQKSFTILFE